MNLRHPAGRVVSALAWLPLAATVAQAQTAPAAPGAAAAPAAAASAPARRPPAAGSAPTQRVEIIGGRESDADQRRQSTAAKIVIGREEIDKFGDATVGEVLRRLPGVTTPGAPGRGGPPRMRGLGGGYTQLLIDGQRVPPGFSLDSLTPEQLERIEILRAPTAETGARAIAGTINIITREGFKRRLNDLRVGSGYENGRFTPGINWTHNDSVDDFIYNVSLALFRPDRLSSFFVDTTRVDTVTGELQEDTSQRSQTHERRTGLALNSRLQWRLNASGDQLVLMPNLFHGAGTSARSFSLAQRVPDPGVTPSLYDFGSGLNDNHFTNLRLNLNWRQRVLGGPRLELNGNVGAWRNVFANMRQEFRSGTATPLRSTDDSGHTNERSINLTAKLSGLAGGSGEPAPGSPPREHSLVGGLELEGVRREETRRLLENGTPLLADFGDNYGASTLRTAAYLQDEWNLNAHWAFHAGLRWESILTRGSAAEGSNDPRPSNRASVATPLLHLLWKPDPKKRDQVRLSLTRSYRSPGTQALIARPSINTRFPTVGGRLNGANEATDPDTAGNPNLKPELATGLDLAFERYLEGGGVLSANVFHRNVSNLMRSVTTLEAVSWSQAERWVSRQQNIGDAITQGIELEAKYRLDQLIDGAPRVEMRQNLALFRSRVDGIPGPDNRLAEQAKGTLNIGADYRLRGTPLSLGGSFNYVPGYRTQLAPERSVRVDDRRVLDVFALWTFSPAVAVRLLASNLLARDAVTVNEFEFSPTSTSNLLRESVASGGPSYTNWQLRLEMKL
jgi:outer membrane receptor for ferrienterochelin and colicins